MAMLSRFGWPALLIIGGGVALLLLGIAMLAFGALSLVTAQASNLPVPSLTSVASSAQFWIDNGPLVAGVGVGVTVVGLLMGGVWSATHGNRTLASTNSRRAR
jgi:hypothetical protein